MRILFVSLALVASSPALSVAEEPSCVKVYREYHAKFLVKADELKSRHRVLFAGGGMGLAAFGSCLWQIRSVIGCGGFFGVATVGSQVYRRQVMGEIKVLEDAYRVYEIYSDIKLENVKGDTVQDLFIDLVTLEDHEPKVLQKFTDMIESGELCKDGAPAKSFSEILASLRTVQTF